MIWGNTPYFWKPFTPLRFCSYLWMRSKTAKSTRYQRCVCVCVFFRVESTGNLVWARDTPEETHRTSGKNAMEMEIYRKKKHMDRYVFLKQNHWFCLKEKFRWEPIWIEIKVDAIVCWDNFDGISHYNCCNVWVGKIMTPLFLETVFLPFRYLHVGVSKNRGTPKSSILIGFSLIFTIHFGGFPPIFGLTPMYIHRICPRHVLKKL